ncbi:hypothetical protein TNCV_248011 [Trichonephila clavipes]|nr:hypothetical protein TNCV_248011 [Trichonephila clavipes]
MYPTHSQQLGSQALDGYRGGRRRVLSCNCPFQSVQGMIYTDEVWKHNWPIHSGNILPFAKYVDPMSSMCLLLPFIQNKSGSTALVKSEYRAPRPHPYSSQ